MWVQQGLQSPRGGGSAVFNFSRPPSVTSTQVPLDDDPGAPGGEASYVPTAPRPPSTGASVRDSGMRSLPCPAPPGPVMGHSLRLHLLHTQIKRREGQAVLLQLHGMLRWS